MRLPYKQGKDTLPKVESHLFVEEHGCLRACLRPHARLTKLAFPARLFPLRKIHKLSRCPSFLSLPWRLCCEENGTSGGVFVREFSWHASL